MNLAELFIVSGCEIGEGEAAADATVGKGVALQIVDAFLESPCEGGRHKTRVDMFMALEN